MDPSDFSKYSYVKESAPREDPVGQYEREKAEDIRRMADDLDVKDAANTFLEKTIPYHYTYYSSWMGRPIIQLPQDILAMQEVIMSVKPTLIIETGIAHGGSLVFSASMLELLGGDREVVGIDIDIRPHNRKAIEAHPMYKRISMLEGSSIDTEIVQRVREIAQRHESILVCLDSCHTHDHVLAELNAYGPLVTIGSYAIVCDTIVEFNPSCVSDNRPWGKGNNPYTAVQAFLKEHPEFETDRSYEDKNILTDHPGGWLRRVR